MADDNHTPAPNNMFCNFVQIGIVVANLDQTIRYLGEIFGIGPFRVINWPPDGRADIQKFYHSKPAEFTARMAFTELGPIELELIQPLEGESIWADFLRDHGGGIHHLRFNVDEIAPVQDYLSKHGILSAQHGSGIRPGTNWMNFASEEKIGFVIEIMNALPGTDGRTPKIVEGKVLD
jgi:methylmalonyl-CoA/ethylmalonyl-CoA epimerase